MGDVAIATEQPTIEELSEALADAFRTGAVGEVFTDDVFLDGHPPFWRFQIHGLDAFAGWLAGYVVGGSKVAVVRTIATTDGFITEHVGEHAENGSRITSRELLLCTVRGSRIAELTVYCSGAWDAELRARHRAEAPMLRP